MAAKLRSDSLHPCHHLSEPLRNMFWCRHCMKIFTDPIDRWRHSKACREPAQNNEEPNQSKQISLKEGTLLRFGVWESDTIVSRPTGPNSKHTTQYGIRIAGTGKVANHKGPVKPQNFDLQCVICKTPFRSIDEMRNHVKTPCNKSTEVQSANKFPSEITNVQLPEEVPQEDNDAEDNVTATEPPSETRVKYIYPEENHVSSDTHTLISANDEKIVLLGNWDEIDGLTFNINGPEYVISTNETTENHKINVPEFVISTNETTENLKINGPEFVTTNETTENLTMNGPEDVVSTNETADNFKINSPDYFASTNEFTENHLSTPNESSKTLVETDKVEGMPLVKLDGKVPALEITKLMLPEILSYTSPTKCPPNTPPVKDTKAVADSSPSPPKKAKISDHKEINSVSGSNNANKTKKVEKSKARKSKKLVSRKKSRNHSPRQQQDKSNKNSSPLKKPSHKNPANDSASPKKDKLEKKPETKKSQKPKKCPACSRIFKSQELLQRHNRIPCRVKLTRNVTAKVLRSKSQSSESGRILQRQGSSGAKPPLNKPIPKRRPKRLAKKITPAYRVNTNLPQYRLTFDSLDPKEQFFYQLDMVPAKSIFLSTEFPGTESLDLNKILDIDNPPSDEEPDQMPVLCQSDEEHVLPPKLEMVSTAEGETGPEDLALMEPPELDLMFPVEILMVDHINQGKAELGTKLENDSFSLCHTKSRKDSTQSRSHKSRYSILDPITSSAKKKVKQTPNQNSVASRTSQRLKAKALAKVVSEKPTVDQNENHTTPSRASSKELPESKTLLEADMPNLTPSSNSPIFTNIKKMEVTPSLGPPKDSSNSQKTHSPKRNLFEALGDSIQQFDSIENPVLENQNRILNKMLGVKSHLDKMLFTKKSPTKKIINDNKLTIKADDKDIMPQEKPRNSKESSPNVPSSIKDLETKVECAKPPKILASIRLPLLASRGCPRGVSPQNHVATQVKIKMVANERRRKIKQKVKAVKRPPSQTVVKTNVLKPGSNFSELQRQLAIVRSIKAAKSPVNESKSTPQSPVTSGVSMPIAKTLSNPRGAIVSPQSCSIVDRTLSPMAIRDASHISNTTYVNNPITEKVTVQYIDQTNTFPTYVDFTSIGADLTPVSVSESAIYLDETSGMLIGDEAIPLHSTIDVAIDPQFQAIHF